MSSSFLQQTSFPLPSKGSWQTVASQPLTSPPREARTSLSPWKDPAGASFMAAGFQPLTPHRSRVSRLGWRRVKLSARVGCRLNKDLKRVAKEKSFGALNNVRGGVGGGAQSSQERSVSESLMCAAFPLESKRKTFQQRGTRSSCGRGAPGWGAARLGFASQVHPL